MRLAWDSGTRSFCMDTFFFIVFMTNVGLAAILLLMFLWLSVVQMWFPGAATHGCVPSTA
jgi:hypothetical protein